MNVIVHRGSKQIGGSIIEVSTSRTKVLLDAGLELDAEEGDPLPSIEGLFDGPAFDAVFFSHNHLDHIGLARSIHPDIPLYLGEKAAAVTEAIARYLGKQLGYKIRKYQHEIPVIVGDIKITPILLPFAFDAYMLLVESEDGSFVFGDFRSTAEIISLTLKNLPARVDTLFAKVQISVMTKAFISEKTRRKAVDLQKT